MKRILIVIAGVVLAAVSLRAGDGRLHVVATGDVHGAWFNRSYLDGGKTPTSLMSVKHYVDSLRLADGPENVLLIDAGDCLQGDNAAYYYNYADTLSPHLYPLMASYMGYDACVLGNHDIETGHPVYDRVAEQMARLGIPWLAGNAFRPDKSLYFPEYALIEKGGRRILVLGYDNANIAGWLSPELWSGMSFKSLVPLVWNRVSALRKELNPDVVVLAVHSGTGKGNGRSLESQGLDIFMSMQGVDVLITAHDHRPVAYNKTGSCLVNAGSRAGFVGHAVLEFRDGRKVSTAGEVVRLDKNAVDEAMVERFDPQYRKVREFTLQPVGRLAMPLYSRDAYTGMCDYLNLLHSVQLRATGADISLAAPLSFNGKVSQGQLIYNDMFTIYPYENQLFVLELSGREIKRFLEYSYDKWICDPRSGHVLRIMNAPDPRTGAPKWSFENRSYNFDSAAGIVYTVDVTKPFGERVEIVSMADGTPFSPSKKYRVAMTSYRANGGGEMLVDGARIPRAKLPSRVVARYPEIRELVYRYISDSGTVDSSMTGDKSLIGEWKFVPESVVEPLMKSDMELVF
ncbi:MAG: bifunctional metallophosphatase/5'-nucleotidase [Bacteroidales bacterium]|nr:bifunctional metallophosphatase/5'-nucleotidase [Bacteroidales bacterium]